MIYCYYFILFSNKNVMCDGYDDWRNVQRTLEIHAKKGDHDLEISMYNDYKSNNKFWLFFNER